MSDVEPDEAVGSVDSRFLLANERTLLAWIRTALALLAAGGAVEQFTEVRGRTLLAVFLAIVGIGSAVAGGVRYLKTANALRQGLPPSNAVSPVALAVAVSLIGVVLLIALIAE